MSPNFRMASFAICVVAGCSRPVGILTEDACLTSVAIESMKPCENPDAPVGEHGMEGPHSWWSARTRLHLHPTASVDHLSPTLIYLTDDNKRSVVWGDGQIDWSGSAHRPALDCRPLVFLVTDQADMVAEIPSRAMWPGRGISDGQPILGAEFAVISGAAACNRGLPSAQLPRCEMAFVYAKPGTDAARLMAVAQSRAQEYGTTRVVVRQGWTRVSANPCDWVGG